MGFSNASERGRKVREDVHEEKKNPLSHYFPNWDGLNTSPRTQWPQGVEVTGQFNTRNKDFTANAVCNHLHTHTPHSQHIITPHEGAFPCIPAATPQHSKRRAQYNGQGHHGGSRLWCTWANGISLKPHAGDQQHDCGNVLSSAPGWE